MSEFKNVTVIREANIFFNGGVSSRTLFFEDGSKKTLGIAQPGTYQFSTAGPELMEIAAGELEVQIVDGEWKSIKGGEAFEVPGNSSFTMKVNAITDYCCTFLP